MRLLLAEDEKELSNALVTILKLKGYDVDAAYDGEMAQERILSQSYDGLILDIMMPKKKRTGSTAGDPGTQDIDTGAVADRTC